VATIAAHTSVSAEAWRVGAASAALMLLNEPEEHGVLLIVVPIGIAEDAEEDPAEK